ncbi:response regulator receiver modulated CheB methylesterase [Thermodesulfobium narugense DSM 14796]|uniref:Protein-glutamate methylesterase/protein-glutamine glutaminase n=1 Tax=Thermodesulfobium narugense DSM 14796 TaxID=747365 RepID=M1E5K3_9BACT|nr:chemotaxis-specific protein-glutamate methyltransferase CheB [Thermodesulfobium narugense]AEE13670.1 response regulator receiver modulated CheB methylesterase [Thermodesulfobium narugense DSM 14796]
MKIKLFIVEDSLVIRSILKRMFQDESDIEVVGEASKVKDAIEGINSLRPDVVTLDVILPDGSGLDVLKKFANSGIPFIMLSSSTTEGAQVTVDALNYGAFDYVPKINPPLGVINVRDDLLRKIRAAYLAKGKIRVKPCPECLPLKKPVVKLEKRVANKAVAIIASTGAPPQIRKVVSELDSNFDASLIIIQHMPVGFTKVFAESLNTICPFPVSEAEEGQSLFANTGVVAKGGFHLRIKSDKSIYLDDKTEAYFGLRPAGDMTLETLAPVFREKLLVVVMTGMGSDGTNGAKIVKSFGGKVYAEDESSCVVFGMPGSIIRANLHDRIVSLSDMPNAIMEFVEN